MTRDDWMLAVAMAVVLIVGGLLWRRFGYGRPERTGVEERRRSWMDWR